MSVRTLLLLICLCCSLMACRKQRCETANLSFSFFPPPDSVDPKTDPVRAYIKVDRYERGSQFKKLQDSYITGSAVRQDSGDSLRNGYGLDTRYDYRIEVLYTGRVFLIRDITIESLTRHDNGLSSEMDRCTNPVHCYVNDQPYTIGVQEVTGNILPGVYVLLSPK